MTVLRNCLQNPYNAHQRHRDGPRHTQVAPLSQCRRYRFRVPSYLMVAPSAPMDTHQRLADRQARKLANATRQAAMLATPNELVDLRRVVDAANTGVISLDDARAAVAQLRRNQMKRRVA